LKAESGKGKAEENDIPPVLFAIVVFLGVTLK
jgi:hypothetical protein